jgi:hypothetical protein
MKTVNLNDTKSFKFHDIFWLLKDKSFYTEVIKILRKRKIFNVTVWSFSVLHGVKKDFYEYMENNATRIKMVKTFQYLRLGKNNVIDKFNVLDYSPLINPRVHNIGEYNHNILNKEFKSTYCSFLTYCIEKETLGPKEKLFLACYLILQDRIKEALELLKEMKDADYTGSSLMSLQFEYLKAYLSLYNEYPTFETARNLSKKYSTFHLKHWRDLFSQIDLQLKEFDAGEDAEAIEDDFEDSTTKKLKVGNELD